MTVNDTKDAKDTKDTNDSDIVEHTFFILGVEEWLRRHPEEIINTLSRVLNELGVRVEATRVTTGTRTYTTYKLVR